MEKMMQRLTMDKATQYTRKEVEKLRRSAEELVGEGWQYMYSGTLLMWTPWGPSKVCCAERCPHFRGNFYILGT